MKKTKRASRVKSPKPASLTAEDVLDLISALDHVETGRLWEKFYLYGVVACSKLLNDPGKSNPKPEQKDLHDATESNATQLANMGSPTTESLVLDYLNPLSNAEPKIGSCLSAIHQMGRDEATRERNPKPRNKPRDFEWLVDFVGRDMSYGDIQKKEKRLGRVASIGKITMAITRMAADYGFDRPLDARMAHKQNPLFVIDNRKRMHPFECSQGRGLRLPRAPLK
jgi:hypothetical protein